MSPVAAWAAPMAAGDSTMISDSAARAAVFGRDHGGHDTAHLAALHAGLSHEKARLVAARTLGERGLRAVWVSQCEKQIEAERRFLGLSDDLAGEALTDDELLTALLA
jgi:hypothetical protein